MKVIPILFASAFSLQACASDIDSTAGISNAKVDTTPVVKGAKLGLKEQIKHCEQDLAKTLNIDPSLIKAVTAEYVTWRSGALGCPSPGKQYTQALVTGTRIVLEANNKRYSYHANKDGVPFYCPRPKNKKPTPLYQDR